MRKPRDLSPRLLGLAYEAPARRLRVTYGALLPYFLTFLGTTTAVTIMDALSIILQLLGEELEEASWLIRARSRIEPVELCDNK